MIYKTLLFCLFFTTIYASDTIFVKSYGLYPDSGVNASEIIKKIFSSSDKLENKVIVFEKGRYDFYQLGCAEKDYYESNTTYVKPRYCAIIIENSNNITVDCRGAEFIFHGKIQPFSIDAGENIVIKNVSIDWDIPFGAEAQIVNVTEGYFDINIDKSRYPFRIDNKKLWFTGEGWNSMWGGVKWNDPMQFDKETLHVTAGTDDDLLGNGWEAKYTAEEIAPGIVRIFHGGNSKLINGNYLVLRHGVRDHSGFYINRSKNILLENINMHSNSGMSFLSQYSENITFKNVNCIPGKGRLIISGHDDGFHFSNCRGKITVDGCILKGLMDDGFNVHGTYVLITERKDVDRVVCRFPHHQSIGLLWGRPGEKIAFINGKNGGYYGFGIIKEVNHLSPELFELVFEDRVPSRIKAGDVLENKSWEPDVTVTGCFFGHHRARGLLVSTGGRIIIENNVFETSGAAIVAPGDIKSYYESSPVNNLTIRNNVFKPACLTSKYMYCDAVITITADIPQVDSESVPFHRNIIISGNDFELGKYPILYAFSADGISFRENRIKTAAKPSQYGTKMNSLTFDFCKNIEVYQNSYDSEDLNRNLMLIRTDMKELKIQKGENIILGI